MKILGWIAGKIERDDHHGADAFFSNSVAPPSQNLFSAPLELSPLGTLPLGRHGIDQRHPAPDFFFRLGWGAYGLRYHGGCDSKSPFRARHRSPRRRRYLVCLGLCGFGDESLHAL